MRHRRGATIATGRGRGSYALLFSVCSGLAGLLCALPCIAHAAAQAPCEVPGYGMSF